MINRETIEISRGVNRFTWSFFDSGIVSTDKIKENQNLIFNYMTFFLIPNQILPPLFQHPMTNPSQPSCSFANQPHFPKDLTVTQLTFGEEFEFLSEQGKEFSREEANKTLKNWRILLEQILEEKCIKDFSINPLYSVLDNFLISLKINIGKWQYRVFFDIDDILEVNTSPYCLDDNFIVQGKAVNVYKLFDFFILNIAEGLHLPTLSGHKHIGIDKALHGNGEILLRLLLDVEKRGWLPRLFMREQKSKSHFRYLSQNMFSAFSLHAVIEAFNRQLRINPKRNKNESFNSIKQLAEAIKAVGLWTHKSVPLNLDHLTANTLELEKEAKAGGVRNACVTIEFRFPQAPRTGKEAKLLNQVFAAWLQLMEKHQHSNKPLELNLDDPMDYAEGKDDKVMELFHDFIQELELELDWDTFKCCSFLQI